MSIDRLKIADFRNYRSLTIEPDPSLTVIVGPNAVGKTNIVEALQLLTEGDSFRRPSWGDLIREGAPAARLSLDASGDDRHLDVVLEVGPGSRRSYRVNGKKKKPSQIAGILPCVVFTPEDLRVVKDAPERRRAALDGLGVQLSSSYSKLRTEYERVLRQRNAALRDGSTTEALSPWDEQLVLLGGSLVTHRTRLFGRVAQAMEVIYASLSDGGSLAARYMPSWERDSIEGGEAPAVMMARHLAEKADVEAARRTTISGPHRDEIVFTVEGREARAFASQGQQRTIALAWKLAEVSVITEIAEQKPVLLLDDVMSELDERRRHALAEFVGSVAQTIITTTNSGYFETALLNRAKVIALS